MKRVKSDIAKKLNSIPRFADGSSIADNYAASEEAGIIRGLNLRFLDIIYESNAVIIKTDIQNHLYKFQ